MRTRTTAVTIGFFLLLATVAAWAPVAHADSGVEGSVTRLYRAYFMRNPDQSGLDFWVSRVKSGRSLPEVSESFARSSEFVKRYGNLDDTAFVDLVYLSVLSRPPDGAGLDHWVRQLSSGRSTRGRVMVGFSESPEFVARAASTAPLALGAVALRQQPTAPNVWDMSDPDVLVVAGRSYIFGSTNNKKVPVQETPTFNEAISDNADRWHRLPLDAMPTRPAWVDPTEWEIWAPSAAVIDGRYHLYFASMRAGATDEANDQCIGRAVAAKPEGPYEPDPQPFYCGLPAFGASNSWGRGALDPEIVTTPRGDHYLLVALSLTNANIGAMRLDAKGNIASKVYFVARQQLDWHDGVEDGAMGSGAFLENPSMTYDTATSTWLLFYSAGRWNTPGYVTGFARCATPLGPCRIDDRGPFMVGGNGRTGPGGLDVFTDPNGVTRVAYATWTAGFEGQVGPYGMYKRQATFARLVTSQTNDPTGQTVELQPG